MRHSPPPGSPPRPGRGSACTPPGCEANAGQGPIAVVVELAPAQATAPLLLSAYGLTAREADVARLVLRGLSTTAIADSLHISANTVQDHLKAVFDKTGVHSRRDLVGHFLATPTKPSP